jgi:hypothetical protein
MTVAAVRGRLANRPYRLQGRGIRLLVADGLEIGYWMASWIRR